LVALLLLPGWLAQAQESQPADDEEVAEVVVTGIRAGLRSSLEVKRNSAQVVDAVSAEAVGDCLVQLAR
jgi:hypothetical protein